ncbi:MAG: hypothetical protein ACT6XY_17375 [Phreatobacter sp.]|uniref:hypothetical protein n=1 Tax=Phreatobacter sp. TaxID=1966341 RepID=UPI0040366281
MSEARETPGAADVSAVWSVLWAIGVGVLGLILFFSGMATRPPDRSALTTADHVGPISYTTPLVTYSSGRRNYSYRTQKIPLVVPGYGPRVVSPPPTLWIDGLDDLRSGQPVRFLVDPRTLLVFEATSRDRTLLAYADSLANRRRRSAGLIIGGLFCLCVAALHGFGMLKAA